MWDKQELLRSVLAPSDSTSYLTHNFHPYPAKFIPQIPRKLILSFTKEGETVFDPFCGSGTTLVEAMLLNRSSIGTDIHPLGVFISRVKTTKIHEKLLQQVNSILSRIEIMINTYYLGDENNNTILDYLETSDTDDQPLDYQIPDFYNRDHWFEKDVQHELAIMKTCILRNVTAVELREFLLLAMSSIMVSISNQESETRYAAISKTIKPRQAFVAFKNRVLGMLERMKAFNAIASNRQCHAYLADSRDLSIIGDNSVSFIVTSPPYPNTFDYYLYHKSRMFWLDLSWEHMKKNEIGSRLRHSSLKQGIEEYVDDMTKCFRHLHRILKPSGYFAIIIGDSVIRKKTTRGDQIVEQLAEETGFNVLDRMNYSLDDVSRMFSSAFRVKGKREHIIILQNIK